MSVQVSFFIDVDGLVWIEKWYFCGSFGILLGYFASLMTLQAGFLHTNSSRSHSPTAPPVLLQPAPAMGHEAPAFPLCEEDYSLLWHRSPAAPDRSWICPGHFCYCWSLPVFGQPLVSFMHFAAVHVLFANTSFGFSPALFCYDGRDKLLWLFHIWSFLTISGSSLFFHFR